MKVLVTGGAGYIGSHTARLLRQAGFEVTLFDNFSTGHRAFTRGFPTIEGDIRIYDEIRAALQGFDSILHFAAHAYVGESVVNPRKYFDNNVVGGLALLNAALDSGVRNIIFSSSCATYGVPEQMPIVESTPQRPLNPYGASKLMFERMLSDYSSAYGLCYVTLRYFNAAGADDSNEIGELHDPEPHLIPRILLAAAGVLSHVDIFGDDYETPDGTCIRDYIHVSDLAIAHVMALRYLLSGGESIALNLGTGAGYSVKGVIEVAREITGRVIKVETGPRRRGDPPVLVANSELALRTLGWAPTKGLPEMVSSAWRWMEKCLADPACSPEQGSIR
jgi:UDP-arabinose 4-epimerase